MEVSSPAIAGGRALPALYTCAGKDVSPPIKWGNVPSNTAELALFLLNLGHTEPVVGGSVKAKLTVGWTVRGLSPRLHGMAAGRLPTGAIAGHARYTICPPKGGTGEYMFRLYALPKPLSLARGVDDLDVFKRINRASSAVGYFATTYTR